MKNSPSPRPVKKGKLTTGAIVTIGDALKVVRGIQKQINKAKHPTQMKSPQDSRERELKIEYFKYCANTFNAGKWDLIGESASWWTRKIAEREGELREAVEKLKEESDQHPMKTMGGTSTTRWNNGYRHALNTVLSLLNKQPPK